MRYAAATIVTLLSSLILGGCGTTPENSHCKDRYSSATTQVAASGLVLEPSENMYVDFWRMETFYQEVAWCMEMETPTGPTVAFLNFTEAGMGGSAGTYSLGTQRLYVNTNEEIRVRDCKSDEQVLKHEYVHHLLWASGVAFENNINHRSAFFGWCT